MELQTSDSIRTDQDAIRKNLVSLDQSIHLNAVQCMMHAEKHGDTSLMRRLLVEIVDAKTGYRRQGLIIWMRTFSPLELTQDNINLSGMDPMTNKPRPWRIEEAFQTPFWALKAADEVVRPMFAETWAGKLNAASKEFRAAAQNTLNGKPIDPTKPFYDGVGAAEVLAFFDKVDNLKAGLPADNTRELRKAQETVKRLAA